MGAQGNSRSGWLCHPERAVSATVVVQEQPVILRATVLSSPVVIQQRVEPPDISVPIYTWSPLCLGGKQQQLDPDNTLLVLTFPGVYRVVTSDTAAIVTYEEDDRTVEWDAVSTGNGAPGPSIVVGIGVAPEVALDHAIPVDVVGTDNYLLATPSVWGKITVGATEYVIPLYNQPTKH